MMAFRSSAVRSVSSLALTLCLRRVEDLVELRHVDVQRHFAEHLDEAAIAIVGEARVAGLGRQPFDGLVVQAQVEDGVHHAGHGKLGARTHADQQRIGGVAELLAAMRFQLLQRLQICWSTSAGTFCCRSRRCRRPSTMVKPGGTGSRRGSFPPGRRPCRRASFIFPSPSAVPPPNDKHICSCFLSAPMNGLRFPKNPRWWRTPRRAC